MHTSHTHTQRKLGSADKFNLHSQTDLGLSSVHHHLISPCPKSQNLSHTTLHCAILMLINTQQPPLGTARRNADFPRD